VFILFIADLLRIEDLFEIIMLLSIKLSGLVFALNL